MTENHARGGEAGAPLAGVRILDLADRSAALAGRVLADLGAEVILVEPPEGSPVRRLAPLLTGVAEPEASTSHQYFGAGKRSVVLDLTTTGGQARFLDLVATADAVIDTARPGDLAALGLDHDELREVNTRLVQVSVTPFGRHTPGQDRAATDLGACAAGGLVWVSGEPGGTPVHGAADPAASMAGLLAASATMTALTGQRLGNHDTGTHIDISLQEAAVMAVMQTGNPTQWTWHGKIPRRPGLSAVLRCADGGYVGLLLRPDRFDNFLAWCDDVGIDHGMTSDDWEWSMLSAPREGNPVAAATRALGKALGRDDFAAGALRADMVCLPVLDFADLEQHEQYVVNDQFVELDHPGLGRALGFVRSPVDEVAGVPPLRPAPLLGADQHLLDDVLPRPQPRPEDEPVGAPAGTAAAADPDPAVALAGLRVVDLTWVLAGPIGTRILAAYGAEVVRVESSTKPDSMRSQIGPDGLPDPDLGGLFNTVNAGKLSLAIDLGHPDGLAAIEELIKGADVVVNNFRPGAMERMGLGYERLRALQPEVILVNLPGAHRHGPWAVRSSMGNILMAASGFNMLTGFDHERPRGIGIAYPDFTTPPLMVAALLAALRHRERTGKGQELHLTQLTGLISLMGPEWMHYRDTGTIPSRRANRDPNHCPHGVFPCRGSVHSDDEWVALAVTGDAQWAALCAVMGRADLVDDPRFADHDARKAHEDELDGIVAEWTADLDKWTAADRLQGAGVAAAPVEHIADTYERDPQLRHHYQVVHQPSAPGVDIPIDGEPAQWRGHELRLRRAPGLGEHNEQVLTELAGLSPDTYLQLLLDGVLG
ncbi:MAG: CoA transferase [Actinomycetota bacterium]